MSCYATPQTPWLLSCWWYRGVLQVLGSLLPRSMLPVMLWCLYYILSLLLTGALSMLVVDTSIVLIAAESPTVYAAGVPASWSTSRGTHPPKVLVTNASLLHAERCWYMLSCASSPMLVVEYIIPSIITPYSPWPIVLLVLSYC